MQYRGAIDTPQSDVVSGWAVDEEGNHCSLSVLVNEGDALEVACEEDRPDLSKSGLSKGKGGFRVDIAARLAAGENLIRIRFPDGSDIPGSPIVRSLRSAPPGELVTYRGFIDIADEEIVAGWAVSDDGLPCIVAVKVNGAVMLTRSGRQRDDLAERGLSNGLGGFRAIIGSSLKGGANAIEILFPDGAHVPGSPVSISRPEIETGPTDLPADIASASSYFGHIDGVEGSTISGWGVTAEGAPCRVTVQADGTAPIEVMTDQPRPDLMEAGYSKGLGGFQVEADLGSGLRRRAIAVRFPDGTHVPGSPVAAAADTDRDIVSDASTSLKELADTAQPLVRPVKRPVKSRANVAKPARGGKGKVALPSLAELDELSLDDISLAVASGMVAVPAPDIPPLPVTKKEAPALTPPLEHYSPGWLARLFGRR